MQALCPLCPGYATESSRKSSYVLHSNFDAQSLCRREKGFQDEHYPARWRLVEWFNAWPANDIIEAAPRDDPGAVQTVPGKRKRNRANDPGCDRLLHANRNELNAEYLEEKHLAEYRGIDKQTVVKAIGWAQSQSDYVFDFAEVGLYQHMAQWQDMGTVASVLEKLSIEVGLYQRHWSNRDCLYSHQQLSSFKQKHGTLPRGPDIEYFIDYMPDVHRDVYLAANRRLDPMTLPNGIHSTVRFLSKSMMEGAQPCLGWMVTPSVAFCARLIECQTCQLEQT